MTTPPAYSPQSANDRSIPKPCDTCSEGEPERTIDISEVLANKCHQPITVLKAVVALMSTNTNTNAELALLRAEVRRLAACHSSAETLASADTNAPTSNPPVTERISITGDGSGAGSPKVYQEMVSRAWTGRLGRTHMLDVDRMSGSARKELDCYLRRTIHNSFPVGGDYVPVNQDTVFATLAVFGLRLEDRGAMADVTIYNDTPTPVRSHLSRMQNFGALYFRRGESYDCYWKGSAIETLVELARYRGLLNSEGYLKV